MSEADVLFEQSGHAGIITLNRPKALNAVTLPMVREMTARLRAWADDTSVRHVIIKAAGGKAFSAGGDIRALYDWGRSGDTAFLDFYREEYQLNTLIRRYPKPYIALMDGIAMGGGVGVSVNGSHRIATQNLTFAMPETGIGLFPDVGGTYFLARCPGEIGMYLGLTGARLKSADALYAAIATHYVDAAGLAELEEELCRSDDVEPLLEDLAAPDAEPSLRSHRQEIDHAFSAHDVETILERLGEMNSEWAAKTQSILSGKSPTSLKITHRQLREGANANFEDCMRIEFRIVNRIFRGHDFFEGTRAVVIDKDQAPQWRPATLAEVSDAEIACYFAPLDVELPV